MKINNQLLKTLTILLITFFCSKQLYAKNKDILFQEFKERMEGLKSFTTKFHQENYTALRNETISAKGVLYFKQPGMMRWEYTDPDPQSIIIGKNKLWIYDPILETVTIEQLKKIEHLDALLYFRNPEKFTQRFTPIESVNKIFLDSKKDHTFLFLKPTPKNKSSLLREIQLRINKINKNTTQIIFLDQENNYRKITLLKLESNRLLSTFFEFKTPPGTEELKNN